MEVTKTNFVIYKQCLNADRWPIVTKVTLFKVAEAPTNRYVYTVQLCLPFIVVKGLV